MSFDQAGPTFIDLFSGCGGFSSGLRTVGFNELAAIDFDPEAVKVFKKNFPEISDFVLERDLRHFSPEELAQIIQTDNLDMIVGGPPCQGFSTIRQRDGSNSGERIIPDDRRELYQQFLKFVAYFNPKIFVMENVLGIRSAVGGEFFDRVQSEARKLGYRVHGEVIKAWEYGVPQKRERQLIIGTQKDLPAFSQSLYMPQTHGKDSHDQVPLVTLWEAIGDLPPLEAGEGEEHSQYDPALREQHLSKFGNRYTLDVLNVNETTTLTSHRARPHSERDLRDFARLHEGETSARALSRGVKMEFPYSRESFKDRFTKQRRDALCSTIVAHLSKDGLMFIHPTQNRSLTPREAARIQSFPDSFEFPVARTHQFRLIGNAVPPLVGKAVGNAILNWLSGAETPKEPWADNKTPQNSMEEILKSVVETLDQINVKEIPLNNFKTGWFAIAHLYKHLHPDSARENGEVQSQDILIDNPRLKEIDERLISPIYKRSGWPVFLAEYAGEAIRRLKGGELSPAEYYCFGNPPNDMGRY